MKAEYEEFKNLSEEELEGIIASLKGKDSEDEAEKALNEFCEVHGFDFGDFQEYLAIECNCCMCNRCGQYFGSDEFSSNDEDCIFCNNEDEEE